MLIGYNSMGQNNLYTNVDTNYFRPKWMADNLKVESFRNGDPIYEAKDKIDFLNKWVTENAPAFIIYPTEIGNQYFYNWEAVLDPRGLAPNGYNIPSPNDFKLFSNSKDNTFNSSGYIDVEGEFLENNGNSLKYWTNTPSKDSTYHADVFLFNSNQGNVDSYNFPMHRSSGISVRCIEDLQESILTKEYSFKELMPKEYKSLLLDLVSNIKSQHDFENDDIVSLKGKIGFYRNGTNRSSLTNLETIGLTFRKQQVTKSSLDTDLQNFNAKPYYKGQIIQSETDFNLVLKYLDTIIRKQEFYPIRLKNLLKLNASHIERANLYDFKCEINEKKFTVLDNLSILYSDNTSEIISFASKGPIYAIGSILPGLGMTLLTQDNFNSDRRKAFKKTLLISSLSLGAISLGSKIISNFYYNRYKDNLFGMSASYNYKKANTFQKVFLTTGFGYCILGAIDFTATFAIGSKNKCIQYKLKKQIKSSPTNFILK